MSQPYALAFVGENANGILRWWTDQIMTSFVSFGLQTCVIDLCNPTWAAQLSALLQRRDPLFCFSFQGMGMNIPLDDGKNLWSAREIPFVSYLGDSPYHMPRLHAVRGPGMYFLYGCPDFLETYTTYMDGRNYATTLQYGYPSNALRDAKPWRQRTHGALYIKTGVDSKALQKEWDIFPEPFRSIMHDCSLSVLQDESRTLTILCHDVFSSRSIHVGDRREFFLSVCSMVDRYVRAVRAERMVSSLLMHEGVTIIGDWSHLDLSRSRATFLPPVHASELDHLYADARVIVNSSPPVRKGVHERIVAGLQAKAAVLSDSTPFSEDLLANCPAFVGVNIDHPDLDDMVAVGLKKLSSDLDMQEKVNESALEVDKVFSIERFSRDIFGFAQLNEIRKHFDVWSFPPAA